MVYDYDRISYDLLKYYIQLRGMKASDFTHALWGNEDKRTLGEFKRKTNPTISTVFKICQILDISLNDLFLKPDKSRQQNLISGNQNIVNSSVISNDIFALQSENKALNMLIKEKDDRISDLKKVNEDLAAKIDLLLRLGHKSDS